MSSEPFAAVDVIRAKRDGERLGDAEIDWVVDAYTRDVVAEEQMAALAMAICVRGMDGAETARLTKAMMASGDRLELDTALPTVDKHSTGGVGDKITLVLAPLVAACGAAVPQLSGRALGHTGGTLDKLESIPGWRAELTTAEVNAQLNEVGAVIAAATEGLAPADRKLYALRDVTGTVESLPLIASSIMSKKLAEGAASLLLDVKVGSGAFMKTRAGAAELARTLVDTGTAGGVATTAVLSDMSAPLGETVGNALEVAEAVQVLRGGGPGDVVELTLVLAREMLALAGVDGVDPAAVLASGAAYRVWLDMIRAQGGDPDAELPTAREVHAVEADRAGYLCELDAYAIGTAAWRLGAGRARRADPVAHAAGVRCLARRGDFVEKGQPVLELHTDSSETVCSARAALDGAYRIAGSPPAAHQLVLDVFR